MPWAQLLRRVLDVDALSCPRCSAPMLVIASITDRVVLEKILEHLGLPTAPPPLLPPRPWWEDIPVDDQAPGSDENDQVPADIDEPSDDVGPRAPRSPP